MPVLKHLLRDDPMKQMHLGVQDTHLSSVQKRKWGDQQD